MRFWRNSRNSRNACHTDNIKLSHDWLAYRIEELRRRVVRRVRLKCTASQHTYCNYGGGDIMPFIPSEVFMDLWSEEAHVQEV